MTRHRREHIFSWENAIGGLPIVIRETLPMRSRWLTRLLCLVAATGLVLSLGCNAFSAERQRRRVQTSMTDLDRIPDDFDWILGFDEPSILYEPTFPPYPR